MVLAVVLVAVLWLEVSLVRGWRCEGSALVCSAVVTAGEEREERRRYDQLLALSNNIQEEGEELTGELAVLLGVVDHWANGLENYWSNSSAGQVTGEDGYLGGWFMFFALPWGAAWPQEPRPQSPLHPLWALYRGRMLIWSAVENGFR